MTTRPAADRTNPTRLFVSILLAVAFNLTAGLALGNAPTQAQRYAQAHAAAGAALAGTPLPAKHHVWYA